MRSEPGNIQRAVVLLEHEGFFGCHAVKEGPAMPRTVYDLVGFSSAISVAQLGRNQVLLPDGTCVAEAQGRVQYRIQDGPPNIDNAEAPGICFRQPPPQHMSQT